jgi:predicted O-methyltransferase YrrM
MIEKMINKMSLLWNKRRIKPIASAPFTVPDKQSLNESRMSIENYYTEYVNNISRADMAASLELTSFLQGVIKFNNFSRIADLGSGFSSYVFRLIARETPTTYVCSVDDNENWLDKTREILAGHNLSVKGVMSLADFIKNDERDFDLLLLDLNFVDVRKEYIKLSIERCKQGGMVIFDDVHKPEFMLEVLKQTRNAGVRLYSLKDQTIDSFGRYALLALKH